MHLSDKTFHCKLGTSGLQQTVVHNREQSILPVQQIGLCPDLYGLRGVGAATAARAMSLPLFLSILISN